MSLTYQLNNISNAASNWNTLLVVMVCFVLGQLAFCSIAVGDDDENLRRYLQRHRLDRLDLRVKEIEFSREVDTVRRRQLAQELAQTYQDQLLKNFDSLETNRKVVSKANLLITEFPELSNLPFQLAISHASYVAAETQFVDWWEFAANQETRTELLSDFIALERELSKQSAENDRLRTGLIAAIPINESEKTTRQQELNRVEARLIHASYLLGWVNYFLAVIPFNTESQRLVDAQAAFYRSLQLERTETIDQVDAKWLDFSSAHSRRVLVGLGMVYAAQSQEQPSKFCFQKLVELDPYTQLSLRQFHSLAYCRNWTLANAFSADALAGKIDVSNQPMFWDSVVTAGIIAAQNDGSLDAQQKAIRLQRTGLLGLLRSFDGAAIRRLITRHNINLDFETSEDLWISGMLDFQEAGLQTAVRKPMLAGAEEKLIKAIELAKVDFDELDRLRIRFLQGLIKFEQGEHESILNSLPEDPEVMKRDSVLAEKIGWLRSRTMIEIARQDHRSIATALNALNRFQSTFPSSSMASRVAFEKTKLTNRLISPSQALEKMLVIQPGNSNYLDAQLELVRLRFRIWEDASSARENPNGDREAYRDLLLADQQFRSLDGAEPNNRLTSMFLAVKASVDRDLESTKVAYDLLTAAEQLIEQNRDELAAGRKQLRYYQFLTDKNAGRFESATAKANWLIEESEDKGYELAALVFLVQQAEQQSAEPVILIPIYEQLAERLGTDHETLVSSRNARATAARLVELNLETGRLDLARQLNDSLLKTAPNQQQLLQNAGRIAIRQEDFQTALPIWRRLASASTAGSDAWFEAKHSMIKCLDKIDRQKAIQVFNQTTALAGELKEPWDQRFKQLETSLQLNAEQTD